MTSSQKTIFEMNELERQKMFENTMELVKKKERSNKKQDIDDIFFLLDKLKIYFFAYMDVKERKIWITKCIDYIERKTELVFQLVETMSVIYKFVSTDLQNDIFVTFIKIYPDLLKTNRGITCISIFIKNTHQVYNSSQELEMKKVLKDLKKVCCGKLEDTYTYIIENYNKEFQKTEEANVLLLIPEFQTATSFLQPPLCMLNVYSNLKQHNIKVDILDNRVFGYSFEQVINLIKDYDYIAMTSTPLDQVQTYFLDYRHTLFCNMVNYLKEKLSDEKKIIVVGSHGTVRPDILVQTISADIIIRGEYDYQLSNLILSLLQEKNIYDIPNLIIKTNGKYLYNQVNDELQHPKEWEDSIIDYSILPVNDYYGYQYINNTHLKKKNWSVMQTTRGCPYNCIFCYNFYTKKVRYKKIENIIKEMKQLQDNLTSEIFFIDQTFTINKKYTYDLCKRIVEEKIKIRWTCETRIDLMDEDLIKIMKEAGCYAIWFGVESFDEKVLKINKKGYKTIDFEETIKLLDKYNLDYRAFIMIGMKGETKESLKETVDKIVKYKIKLSKTIVQCQERYGTPLFDDISPDVKEKLNRFEILGLRKGKLSNKIEQEDINEAVKRLMILANQSK